MPDILIHDNKRLELDYIPINQVRPARRDARTYSRTERRRIIKAIRTFGPVPLVVTTDKINLSGNVWLECLREASIDPVPVVVAAHLSPMEAEAFMIAQVGLIERGEWDRQVLGEIFRDLTLAPIEFDLSITGFDLPEIDLLIEDAESGPETGADVADEPVESHPSPAMSRIGDLWLLGPHRVYCGDALALSSFATGRRSRRDGVHRSALQRED